jgi:hypothetical protein
MVGAVFLEQEKCLRGVGEEDRNQGFSFVCNYSSKCDAISEHRDIYKYMELLTYEIVVIFCGV